MNSPDFSDLDQYLTTWGLRTIEERITRRAASSLAEMQQFHDTMVPRLEEITDFLNRFSVDEIPEQYQPLQYAVLALLQVDRPVNQWKKALLEDARDPRSFQMKTSFHDSAVPKR